jgi:hypothetical protein
MARRIRTLIDSLKRRRGDQRAKDAARIKRQQDEKRHRRGGGDHVGGVPSDYVGGGGQGGGVGGGVGGGF